ATATKAYSWATLARLCAKEKDVENARQDLQSLRTNVEHIVERSRQVLRLRHELEAQRRRIEERRHLVEQRARRVEEASGISEGLAIQVAAARKLETSEDIAQRIERLVVTLRQDRIILEDLRAMLARQRGHAASELAFVYPIELGDDGWTICGLRLARADDIRGRVANEETAAALGIVASVVDHVAQSTGVPVRYPLVPRGSRSVIVNPGAIPVQTAPLFMLRAGDRPRLRAAVRLVATDIEQLLGAFGIDDVDRHQILPNLTQLLLAIESSSYAA
ncbi:hypothetical protein GGF43_001496, partial [Coemansia sp. RSA 2618]